MLQFFKTHDNPQLLLWILVWLTMWYVAKWPDIFEGTIYSLFLFFFSNFSASYSLTMFNTTYLKWKVLEIKLITRTRNNFSISLWKQSSQTFLILILTSLKNLAPHRCYILVYGTCSTQWIFFYPLLKGICSIFYVFQVGFVQAFPFPILVSGEWSQSKFAVHL
jgi:hypothetical protein